MGICAGYMISSPSVPFILKNLLITLFTSSLSLSSAILNHALLIATNLKWACNFLFHQSLFHHRHLLDAPEAAEALRVRRYSKRTRARASASAEGEEEEEEEEECCAVCLCGIEEGEEIKELRCDHLFHSECLDRWVGYRHHATCPLCRDSLAQRRLFDHLGQEVLIFDFSSLSSRDRSAWWLR